MKSGLAVSGEIAAFWFANRKKVTAAGWLVMLRVAGRPARSSPEMSSASWVSPDWTFRRWVEAIALRRTMRGHAGLSPQ